MYITRLIFIILLILFGNTLRGQTLRYFNKNKLGILPGLKGTANSAFDAQGGGQIATVHGVYLNKKIALGVGIGASSYNNPTISTIPVYFNLDYYLSDKRSTPYLYGNLGYSFVHTPTLIGGVFSESGIGWRFKTGKKNGYMGPEIGYRFINYQYSFINAPGRASDYLDALSLSFSFSF